MNECKVTELRTFVPSRDYDLSTRFYGDLGYEVAWAANEVQEMRIEGFAFSFRTTIRRNGRITS